MTNNERNIDFEKMYKAGLFLFAVLYIIGFLVTSIYSNHIGVNFVSFLQLQYVVAGAFFCYPIISSIAVINFVRLFSKFSFKRYKISDLKYELLKVIWGLIRGICYYSFYAFLAILVIALPILSFVLNNIHELFSFFRGGYIYLIIIIGLGYMILQKIVINKDIIGVEFLKNAPDSNVKSEEEAKKINDGALIPIVTIWCVIFSFYLSSYSINILPLIPQALAGTKPQKVMLIIKDDSKPYCYQKPKQDSLPFSLSCFIRDSNPLKITDTVYNNEYLLLFENDNKLVLKANTNSSESFILYKESLSGVKILTK